MNFRTILRNIISNPQVFFLKNLGVKQTIAKNTFWLAVAEGVTLILGIVLNLTLKIVMLKLGMSCILKPTSL